MHHYALEAYMCRHRSCAQFSFAQVQSVLQGNSLSESIKLHDCTALQMESALRAISTLATSLRQRRLGLNKSAIGQKARLSFELNANGFPEAISTTTHCEAQDALQELCIMANVSVAQKITKYFPEHALLRRQDPIIDTLLVSMVQSTCCIRSKDIECLIRRFRNHLRRMTPS
jgi:exoribonuclease R